MVHNAMNNDDLMSDTQVRRYLNIKEAARLLKVCAKTIRRWDAAGKITCYRTQGGHRRIPMSEVIRLRSRKADPPALNIDHLQDDIVNREQMSHSSRKKVPYLIQEATSHQEQKAPILQDQNPPLRHDMNALKSQLKLLRYLLVNSFNSEANILVLTELINIMREITRSSNILLPLRQVITEFWSKAMLHLQELEKYMVEQQQSPPNTQLIPSPHTSPRKRNPSADFQAARKNASELFFQLIKATVDARLDPEESTRANDIIDGILSPYRQLTQYLIDYPEGALEHDIIKLLLTAHPSDYNIQKNRWSVRTLACACKQLGTKSCSKSQIGRFYKKIGWHRLISKELISPDPKFGEKMKAIGNAIASLKEGDCLLYGDEFKFTSSKVAQHLTPSHAPAGLQHALARTSNAYYRPVCSIQITGVFNPNTNHLEATEILDLTFESVAQGIVQLCKGVLDKITGRIVLILDNASNHSPGLLKPYLNKYLGDRINLYYLPTYSPNNNPIEGIWNVLLDSIVRQCSTKTELRTVFSQAVHTFRKVNQGKPIREHTLYCPICHTHLSFSDDQQVSGAELVDRHLCFNIPGLTPYTVDVLTHSLEVIS